MREGAVQLLHTDIKVDCNRSIYALLPLNQEMHRASSFKVLWESPTSSSRSHHTIVGTSEFILHHDDVGGFAEDCFHNISRFKGPLSPYGLLRRKKSIPFLIKHLNLPSERQLVFCKKSNYIDGRGNAIHVLDLQWWVEIFSPTLTPLPLLPKCKTEDTFIWRSVFMKSIIPFHSIFPVTKTV